MFLTFILNKKVKSSPIVLDTKKKILFLLFVSYFTKAVIKNLFGSLNTTLLVRGRETSKKIS
ncbi:hypothetical protein BpHYR1_002529 [Brachionus plicatilis]|uniref:Uncharacterized protein n=1 Tax=Brachionus plicatilis TaxID=10195 RepID=A0A3M7SQP5_BRAPC|nr:hypothetical protein BpHYR1_002529 [Brachionus plicatilis]